MSGNVIVSNWREVLRHWSLWLGGLGTTLAGWMVLAPESAFMAWAALPDDMKAALPPTLVGYTAVVLLALSLVAKFINQRKLRKG